jgi:hypothetical protein
MGCLHVVRHREVSGFIDQGLARRVLVNVQTLRDFVMSRSALRLLLWLMAAEFAVGHIYMYVNRQGVGWKLMFLLPAVLALPVVARHRRRLILKRLWNENRNWNA